mmetsp:Transcript_50094/g.138806  ORF Transcript_50094/g.138806 Transcript_50094/m.138806 type:complete len:87 (-) Transcript_50094:554-814(-)
MPRQTARVDRMMHLRRQLALHASERAVEHTYKRSRRPSAFRCSLLAPWMRPSATNGLGSSITARAALGAMRRLLAILPPPTSFTQS